MKLKCLSLIWVMYKIYVHADILKENDPLKVYASWQMGRSSKSFEVGSKGIDRRQKGV